MQRLFWGLLISLLMATAQADTRIAVLDFELRDMTMAPGIPAEVKRTAAIKSMLSGELAKAGYTLVDISLAAQQRANAGFGYLFEHPDAAAELAKAAGAEYVVVGRLHKASFLFAYIMAHLVRVADGALLGNYSIETKGGETKLTFKAVETLTVNIDQDLNQSYMLAAPVAGPLK